MSLRRVFFAIAALALLAPVAQALTFGEIRQSSLTQPQVLGVSSYPSITVTSSTNKSLTVTATPVSFDGTYWQYQFSWTRAKNAVGSLYVSQKGGSQSMVVSIDSAAKQGNVTGNLLPSTAYRVEFYGQASGAGTLLLRKTLTARAVEAATAGSVSFSFPGNSAVSNGTTAGSAGGSNCGTPGLTCESLADMISKTYGIKWNTSNLPIDQTPYASTNPYSPDTYYGTPSVQVGLKKLTELGDGKTSVVWVGRWNFFDGKDCYQADLTNGTLKETKIQCYANHPLPTLAHGQKPPLNDTTYPWALANADCYYTYGDKSTVINGVRVENPAWQMGSSRDASCIAVGLPDMTSPVNLSGANPVSYNGLPVDDGTFPDSAAYKAFRSTNNPPTIDVALGTKKVNANGGGSVPWTGVINIKKTDGKCYTRDATSGTVIDTEIQCFANHPLPTWTQSGMPDPYSSTFDFSAANAICYYTWGKGKTFEYESRTMICGPNASQSPAYPNSPWIQRPSSSDTLKVTSMKFRLGFEQMSGAPTVCYQYADGRVFQTSCAPNALPPYIDPPGVVPSGNDPNFDWVRAEAKCIVIATGQPASCGQSVNATGMNGTCGTAVNQVYASLNSSAAGLCSYGTMVNFSGIGPWTWTCQGTNGGQNTTCTAYTQSTQPASLPIGNTTTSGTNLNATTATIGSGTVTLPKIYNNTLLHFSSSNPAIVSVPEAVYFSDNDKLDTVISCVGHGAASVTVSGYGYPTTIQTVTCP